MDEIDLEFGAYEAWIAWWDQNAARFTPQQIDAFADRIRTQGAEEPLTGQIAAPGTLDSIAPNWREGLGHRGVNSRMRAVLKVIAELPAMPERQHMGVYAPEALSAFSERLRTVYPRFTGSEFSDDPVIRASFGAVPCEDLCALSMGASSVDLVVTNDVLEHVADLDAALSEIARVLRPGGWHVGTCPFRFFDLASQVRARMVDGQVHHLLEPEYHGDPINPAGALVFEIPGWDILERCRQSGFARASWRYVLSERYGCLSPHIGGIFVLTAQR